MDRVHPDTVADERALHRDRLGEQPHPAFRGAVRRERRRAAQAGDGRHHDDRAAARAPHGG